IDHRPQRGIDLRIENLHHLNTGSFYDGPSGIADQDGIPAAQVLPKYKSGRSQLAASFRNGPDDLFFEPFHMVWIHARLQHTGAPDSDQIVALVGMRGRDQRVIDVEFGGQGFADIDDVRIHKSNGVDRDQRYAMVAIVEHHGSGPYLIVDAVGGLVVVESRDPYRVKFSVSIEVV